MRYKLADNVYTFTRWIERCIVHASFVRTAYHKFDRYEWRHTKLNFKIKNIVAPPRFFIDLCSDMNSEICIHHKKENPYVTFMF